MSCALYSDNQTDVDALARRIVALTSFSSEQASSVAFSLLCRKVLKIKSGALAQLFKSVDTEVDTKRMRDEFVRAGLIARIEGTGLGGRPAVYHICANVAELPQDESEPAETVNVADSDVDEPADVELSGDQLLSSSKGDDASEVPKSELQDESASETGCATEGVVASEAPETSVNSETAKPAEYPAQTQQAKRVRRKRSCADERTDSCVPSGMRTASEQEKPEKSVKRAAKVAKDNQAANHKTRARKRAVPVDATTPCNQEAANAQPVTPSQAEMQGNQVTADSQATSTSIVRALAGRLTRVLPTPTVLAKIQEKRTEIVKVPDTEAKPARVERSRAQHVNPTKAQLASDFATITAWIEQANGMNVPYASRRQRAFEIFNDEKAFDGKRGERLFKRLNDRGVNISALKITPQRASHFQNFFGIGADKPFIVVENIDTYEEIVRLLRGNSSVKLFGQRVSGVIFGGGCKVNVAHALDDFLSDIGYRYNYVYYAGDIDREGARIVEQARAANNVQIRMHAGMYRAMLAAHARRLKEGKAVEAASENQGVPQNLARAIADLPMVTRVQFRNVLRQGGRIPQEILTSADYRDSSSGPIDRLLNS